MINNNIDNPAFNNFIDSERKVRRTSMYSREEMNKLLSALTYGRKTRETDHRDALKDLGGGILEGLVQLLYENNILNYKDLQEHCRKSGVKLHVYLFNIIDEYVQSKDLTDGQEAGSE